MQCALCSNETFENLSQVDAKTSERLLVSLCKKCGLIQQTPIPTLEELKVFYSHNYRMDYKHTYSPKPKHVYRSARVASRRIKFLQEQGVTRGRLLDVGAGGGEFVYLAGQMGFHAQGVEPSVGYSEYAKHEYDVSVATGQLDDVQGKYDVVSMFHVLEHLPCPLRAFEKLYRLLNDCGKLFVEVPWIETSATSPNNSYFKAHIFYFSVETLIACASQYFHVVTVKTSPNLQLLLEAKTTPTSLELPSAQSVERLIDRVSNKGWFDYLIRGRGILKPLEKIAGRTKEFYFGGLSSKEMLDRLLPGSRSPRTMAHEKVLPVLGHLGK